MGPAAEPSQGRPADAGRPVPGLRRSPRLHGGHALAREKGISRTPDSSGLNAHEAHAPRGRLRPGQVVGTVLTVALCYFLWRGSNVAHIVLLVCAALSILYALVSSALPHYMQAGFLAIAAALLLALSAPATWSFLAYQRQRSA